MAKENLTSAKNAKNDEFYTKFSDIQREIEAYLDFNQEAFAGKVVYCNCDDPYESNFFRYFVLNFKKLGLKRLITTSFKPSPIANTQLVLDIDFEPSSSKGRPKATANKFVINKVRNVDIGGSFSLADVAEQLKANKNNEWSPLEGDGDFRSDECIKLLKESDIVVTNPPFSLFREYVKQIVDHGKKFVIVGSKNAITYREIFPLIKSNEMWVGASGFSQDMLFIAPQGEDLSEKPKTALRVVDGVTYLRSPSIWFTNLDHGRRHQPLQLMSMKDNLRYNKKMLGQSSYVSYDNYDAIDVPFTNAIPNDYDGIMGVPISFLDKYNPEQFEIIALGNSKENFSPNKVYENAKKILKDGRIQNGNAINNVLAIKTETPPNDQIYYKDGHQILMAPYARILIKSKKVSK
jgi:Adenine-specific methyltransferase EcoRI